MIKIAITGPESCGKTTLAEALNNHFQGELVEEYARKYLTEKGGEYEFEDLIEIATTHRNNIHLSQKSIQIVDTDFVLMKVWYDDKFSKTPSEIIEWINDDIFHLHILCAPDIPWVDDPLRENKDDREKLFERYIEELDRFKKTYIIVAGPHEKRFEKSLASIESLLK